jgi:hypothetical protein
VAFAVGAQVVKSELPPRKAALVSVGMVAAFFGVLALTGDPPGGRRRNDRPAGEPAPLSA